MPELSGAEQGAIALCLSCGARVRHDRLSDHDCAVCSSDGLLHPLQERDSTDPLKEPRAGQGLPAAETCRHSRGRWIHTEFGARPHHRDVEHQSCRIAGSAEAP
jgi:hypothetical protein